MKKLAIVSGRRHGCADGKCRRQRRRQFGEGESLDSTYAIADCYAIPDGHQVRATAIGIGTAITTTIATGATVTTGRYYSSYLGYYAPRPHGYYGGPRYYGGGPGVTFSFGSGGYRGW